MIRRPIASVQLLAVNDQRTEKGHYGTRGIDRTDDGERQMLHGIIAANPRRQDDDGLEEHQSMGMPTGQRHILRVSAQRHQDEGKEKRSTHHGVDHQYGQHGITSQGLLYEDVIEA